MLITVFTPTYNRAYTLNRLYESLCKQTDCDFQWLIVDDGSTDNTKQLIDSFTNHKFDLDYVCQKNGGKHRAINTGVKLAKGELFFIVDSDDFLREDAVALIKYYWQKKTCVCQGLCFRRQDYESNQIFGKSFPKKEFYASYAKIQFGLGYSIDKAEVFRTDILQKFPFPEIDGEKFCTEAVVWLAMSRYKINKLYCVDEGIYLCKYLPDGLTQNSNAIKEKNPKGYKLFYKELLKTIYLYKNPKQVLVTILLLLGLKK